jgi:hypothetical protein
MIPVVLSMGSVCTTGMAGPGGHRAPAPQALTLHNMTRIPTAHILRIVYGKAFSYHIAHIHPVLQIPFKCTQDWNRVV